IKRPRNAFMIFRSERAVAVLESRVEHDNRKISQILGEVWNHLDDGEKSYYRRRAADEKEEHMLKYPDYRFAPRPRTEKAKKR
ncbi:high mobility group box domain-containing protein, partial [Trametes elegans]